VLVFDNLSALSKTMSDAYCRISSGIGSSLRKLFTDSGEFSVRGSRPIFVTAVNNPVTEPDLAQRLVALRLSEVEEERRLPNTRLWAMFERDRAAILGALYDIVAYGLKRLPDLRVPRLPRLAEFAECGIAAEGAFCEAGGFMAAFEATTTEAVAAIMDDDPIFKAIVAYVTDRGPWGGTEGGTATALLAALQISDRQGFSTWRNWPVDPRAFGTRLWRLVRVLRKAGVEVVDLGRTKDRQRNRLLALRPVSDREPFADNGASQTAGDGMAETPARAFPT
jgi:hypothetical protein